MYFAYDENDNIVYVGITKQDPEVRKQQHNMIKDDRYVTLEPQTEKLTRNQARALEQYYIGYDLPKGKKNFVDNLINSIGPNNKYLNDSREWAEKYVLEHGMQKIVNGKLVE